MVIVEKGPRLIGCVWVFAYGHERQPLHKARKQFYAECIKAGLKRPVAKLFSEHITSKYVNKSGNRVNLKGGISVTISTAAIGKKTLKRLPMVDRWEVSHETIVASYGEGPGAPRKLKEGDVLPGCYSVYYEG